MTESPPRANLTRSTITVMVGFGLAKAISLLQTVVIARAFGVGEVWDAFVTANRIPEMIFTLIAGGALATAFLPVFSGLLAEGNRERAWRTASHVVNSIFLITLLVSAVVFVLAPWLVGQVVAPGFTPEAQAQTVGLMRVLLVSTLIFSVSGIVMGILQSHNHFFLPALAPIMFDLGILFGVLVLMRLFGVYGIAYGAVLGAALHLLIQVPGLVMFKARWSAALGFKDPELWRIFRLMLPRIGGLGVFSLNIIVMNNIASRLGTGSVAALDWGWRLMQIPQTLIGTAMGVVIFPTLAALSQLGDLDGKRSALSGAVRFILIGSIPSAFGLILVGRPLISLLEGGAFDAAASGLVYSTLVCFSLGLIVHSVLEVVARGFYADKDTFTPFLAAVGGALINFALALVLSGVLVADGPEDAFPGGLALANSAGVAFEVIMLMIILRRRWAGIDGGALHRAIVKTTLASLVMSLVILGVDVAWGALGIGGGLVMTVGLVGAQVLLGGLTFVGVAYAIGLTEVSTLLNAVLRRRTLAITTQQEA
jgi:putative peptidoglycan lipid II flippase